MSDDEQTPYYTQQIPDRSPSKGDDETAIDLLIHNRPRILRIKLAVLATQIQERLQVRAHNQEKIATQLLESSNRLLPFEEILVRYQALDESTRRFWLETQSKLEAETRAQDVECWRDVAQVMTEFLNVWEAVEQSKVRAEFLREQRREDQE